MKNKRKLSIENFSLTEQINECHGYKKFMENLNATLLRCDALDKIPYVGDVSAAVVIVYFKSHGASKNLFTLFLMKESIVLWMWMSTKYIGIRKTTMFAYLQIQIDISVPPQIKQEEEQETFPETIPEPTPTRQSKKYNKVDIYINMDVY